MKKIIIVGLAVIIVSGTVVAAFLYSRHIKQANIQSYEECVQKGYPVMETYPERCKTPDGRTFTKQVSSQEIKTIGEFECLPHKDTTGPQTLECAFGIKDEKGDHYGMIRS